MQSTIPLWHSDFELPHKDTVLEHYDYPDFVHPFGLGSSDPILDIANIFPGPSSSSSTAYSANSDSVDSAPWWTTAPQIPQVVPSLIDPNTAPWLCGDIPINTVIQSLDPPAEHVEDCLWSAPSSSTTSNLYHGTSLPFAIPSTVALQSWSSSSSQPASTSTASVPDHDPNFVPPEFDPSLYISSDYSGVNMWQADSQSTNWSSFQPPLGNIPTAADFPQLGPNLFDLVLDFPLPDPMNDSSLAGTFPLTATPQEVLPPSFGIPCGSSNLFSELPAFAFDGPSLRSEGLPTSNAPTRPSGSREKASKPRALRPLEDKTRPSRRQSAKKTHAMPCPTASVTPSPSSSRCSSTARTISFPRRNATALTQAQVNSIGKTSKTFLCPLRQCHFSDPSNAFTKRADFRRHLDTHLLEPPPDLSRWKWSWKCAGIPVDEAKLTDAQRHELRNSWRFEGQLMAGGCLGNYSRKDVLGKHLRFGKCLGQTNAPYHGRMDNADPEVVRRLLPQL